MLLSANSQNEIDIQFYAFLPEIAQKSTKSELDLGITKKANASASDVGGVHLYWPIDID